MNIIWLILVVLVVPSWAITNSLNAVEVEHLISSIKCDVCTIRKKFRQHGKGLLHKQALQMEMIVPQDTLKALIEYNENIHCFANCTLVDGICVEKSLQVIIGSQAENFDSLAHLTLDTGALNSAHCVGLPSFFVESPKQASRPVLSLESSKIARLKCWMLIKEQEKLDKVYWIFGSCVIAVVIFIASCKILCCAKQRWIRQHERRPEANTTEENFHL